MAGTVMETNTDDEREGRREMAGSAFRHYYTRFISNNNEQDPVRRQSLKLRGKGSSPRHCASLWSLPY